jgi:signal transduction histidine kinase
VKQVFLPGYSTKKRGWGLGLAFVKRIVEDYHRGRITVEESVPDVGTTFLISLPAAPRETQEAG